MLIGASPERSPTGESLSFGRVANCVPGYPADIRKVIYTTNAVESPNLSPRKVIKTRGSFPNQEAAMKLRYLALEHIAKQWSIRFRTGRLPCSASRFCSDRFANIQKHYMLKSSDIRLLLPSLVSPSRVRLVGHSRMARTTCSKSLRKTSPSKCGK